MLQKVIKVVNIYNKNILFTNNLQIIVFLSYIESYIEVVDKIVLDKISERKYMKISFKRYFKKYKV